VELQLCDGPFVVPDDACRENAVLRYSEGGQDNGFSLTGVVYHQIWTNTTDIPLRAVSNVGYFGSLNRPMTATQHAAASRRTITVRQAKLALSSRCKSPRGKAVARGPVASVAWSPVTTAAKRTQQSCGVGY
jgi:hypothetical protein